MTLRVGSRRHAARLKFVRHLREWTLRLGPIALTPRAARYCRVQIDSLTAAEAAALAVTGFKWLLERREAA